MNLKLGISIKATTLYKFSATKDCSLTLFYFSDSVIKSSFHYKYWLLQAKEVKMKVFISWSGQRSNALGQSLHDWIPMVLQHVEPWLSESDISAGERWANEVGKELETSNFGIICMTRENISSPWILFEAGALAKFMQEGRVVPLLLDIEFKDIAGPLAQFQAKKAEKEGIFDIVRSINRFSEGKISDVLLNRQLEALWGAFEKQLVALPKAPTQAKQNRPQHEILEELVSGIRGLETRFHETQKDSPRIRRRKNRLHPMMLRDFLYSSEFGPRDPIRYLFFSSLIKDDLPWIYELGVDAYREAINRRSQTTIAQHRFFSFIKMLRQGPLLDLIDDKETYMMIREFEHIFMDMEPDYILSDHQGREIRPKNKINEDEKL